MPARSNIPPEAFEEICSSMLGFREARRIYGIGHAQYKKIQQRVESPPSVVPPPIAFRKRGGTPVARFSRTCMLYSRVAQTSFYPTKNTRSWWGRRKWQRHSTPSSIYGTSLDSSANSIDSNTTTSLPSDMHKTSRRCECTQGTRLAL